MKGGSEPTFLSLSFEKQFLYFVLRLLSGFQRFFHDRVNVLNLVFFEVLPQLLIEGS